MPCTAGGIPVKCATPCSFLGTRSLWPRALPLHTLQGVADALIEALRRAGGGTVVMCDTEASAQCSCCMLACKWQLLSCRACSCLAALRRRRAMPPTGLPPPTLPCLQGQLWSHHLPAEMANSGVHGGGRWLHGPAQTVCLRCTRVAALLASSHTHACFRQTPVHSSLACARAPLLSRVQKPRRSSAAAACCRTASPILTRLLHVCPDCTRRGRRGPQQRQRERQRPFDGLGHSRLAGGRKPRSHCRPGPVLAHASGPAAAAAPG